MSISSSLPRSRSLALSVYFKHPDLGMKDFEILSRATAFLLDVDPMTDTMTLKDNTNPSTYLKTRAGGPSRDSRDLGWLEFCPVEFRPAVHVVASSHVLSPFRTQWLDTYYNAQKSWLQHVEQEHCVYSLEVFDTLGSGNNYSEQRLNPAKCLAKFALNPYPIHHPDDLDLGIIHLKNESESLKQMKNLGVETLQLRDVETNFYPNESVSFDGFEVASPNGSESGSIPTEAPSEEYFSFDNEDDDTKNVEESEKFFVPYLVEGNLIHASKERILAITEKPLPDGLCGGPVIDENGLVAGVVEGVVPQDHANKNVAGAASFIPAEIIDSFIDMAEMRMLEQIMPTDLFEKVAQLKSGNPQDSSAQDINISSSNSGSLDGQLDGDMEQILASLREHMSQEDIEKLRNQAQNETAQVIDLLEKGEDADLQDAIETVRRENDEKSK